MSFFVTGTDTGVGKTIVSAWLARHLGASYWKPVQSGLEERDSHTVASLAGLRSSQVFPEKYLLKEPLSPHEAAKREGVRIQLSDFVLPQISEPLIVEGAGGVLVPLNDNTMMVDLMRRLGLPVILVTRTTLGTINHTLLSLHVLHACKIEVAGLVMVGPPIQHNAEALQAFTGERIIGHIPHLNPLTPQSLAAVPLQSESFKTANAK